MVIALPILMDAWGGLPEALEASRLLQLADRRRLTVIQQGLLRETPTMVQLAKSRDVILSRASTLKKFSQESLSMFSARPPGSEHEFAAQFAARFQQEARQALQQPPPQAGIPPHFQWATQLIQQTQGLQKDSRLSTRSAAVFQKGYEAMSHHASTIDEALLLHRELITKLEEPSFLEKQAYLSLKTPHIEQEFQQIHHTFLHSGLSLEQRTQVARTQLSRLVEEAFIPDPDHPNDPLRPTDREPMLRLIHQFHDLANPQRGLSYYRAVGDTVQVRLLKASDAFGMPRGFTLQVPQNIWDRLYEDHPIDPLSYSDYEPLSLDVTRTNPLGDQLFSGERLRAWQEFQRGGEPAGGGGGM